MTDRSGFPGLRLMTNPRFARVRRPERFAVENICGPGPHVPARRFHVAIGAAAIHLRLLRWRGFSLALRRQTGLTERRIRPADILKHKTVQRRSAPNMRSFAADLSGYGTVRWRRHDEKRADEQQTCCPAWNSGISSGHLVGFTLYILYPRLTT